MRPFQPAIVHRTRRANLRLRSTTLIKKSRPQFLLAAPTADRSISFITGDRNSHIDSYKVFTKRRHGDNVANAAVVIVYRLVFARILNDIAIGWVLGEVVNLVLFVWADPKKARRNHAQFIIK